MNRKVIIKSIDLQLREQYTIRIRKPIYGGNREVDICGKIFSGNMPIKGAIVLLFRRVGNKKIPIKYCITDNKGVYFFRINYYSCYDEIIGITSFNGDRGCRGKRNIKTIKQNIKVDDINDIIFYGKVIDSYEEPISGAIVVAFCDDGNKMKAICHTFTDIDGRYIFNIKYDLYNDKKIVIKSANTSNSVISYDNYESNEESNYEH